MRTGTPGFQSERLVEAREIRGLTQLALGELIGKPNTTISRWEKGTQLPENDGLEALSNALRVPMAFFMQPVPDHGSQAFFFRSMASATLQERKRTRNRLRWLQDISLVLQEWIEFPEVDVPKIEVHNYKDLTENNIEEAANRCREHWGLGQGPIPDSLLVLENAGILVGKEAIGSTKMDGLSNWSMVDGKPYVLIASDKDACVRTRMDAAHELGHLVLHRYIDAGLLTKPEHFKEIEAQAFLFAGAFLMPADSFGAEVWSPSLNTFLALKERWKTAIAAMIMRCRQLSLTTDGYEKHLWKYYSARGWRKGEPLDNTLEVENPRLFTRSIKLLIDEKIRTREELLSDFRLDAHDVESLCGLPRGFLSHGPAEVIAMPKVKRPSATNPQSQPGNVVPFRSDKGK